MYERIASFGITGARVVVILATVTDKSVITYAPQCLSFAYTPSQIAAYDSLCIALP